MSGSSFTNVFGGNAVKPSQPSFLALTIAVTTALYWPLETLEGVPAVAALMNVNATAGALELQMPPGNTGSAGVACIVANVGANTFTLTDTAGNAIAVIATTQAWVIALTDNSTTNGAWVAYQLASTTSSASAASLAGYGLSTEIGNPVKLMINWTRDAFSVSSLAGVATRGSNFVYTGTGAANLQFDTTVNLGPGYVAAITNEGGGELTLLTSDGETINGEASVIVQPGQSGFIIGGTGTFDTYGLLAGPLAINAGGTGATTANGALTNLGGTDVGVAIFTAPNVAAVISFLGLQNYTFIESSVSGDQVLVAGSSATAFVATAANSFTMPLSTTISTKWVVAILAQNGNVTIHPQASDAINGGTVGADYTIPNGSSGMLVTDAAGNFYVLFNGGGSSGAGPWVVAGGSSDVITAAYVPAVTALTDGLLLGFRAIAANATSTPTFSPNGLPVRNITYDGGFPLVVGAIAGPRAECLVRYNLANTRWELLNPAIPLDKITTVNVAGSSNVNLSSAQIALPILVFTGALTGDVTVFIPGDTGQWTVLNATTGPYTLSFGVVSGANTVLLPQGQSSIWWSDGSDTLPSVAAEIIDSVISSSQTVVVPANIFSVEYDASGAGGGGGASANCSGSQVSCAPAGNAGCRATGVLAVSPGDSLVITIGTAGAGGIVSGANGAQGGSTLLVHNTTTITAPGGHGGANATATAPPVVQAPNAGAGMATGGDANYGEIYGQAGIGCAGNNTMGGAGGGEGGGAPSIAGAAGNNAVAFRAGGGGANAQFSGTGAAGGNGGGGVAILKWVSVV